MRKCLVAVLLTVLVLTVGAAVVYLAVLNHSFVTNISHESLLPPSTPSEASTDTGSPETNPSTASPSTGVVSHGDVPVRKALNILLIGSDGKTSVANGRSDVIILVHINSDRKKLYLVHFPRDMYVEVPGHGKDKINAAYAYGGPQLLIRTLRNLVDVPIDHAAVIGFEGFKAMTDAVGGVDVYAEEASTENGTINMGMNHLDGEQALNFVRERYQLSQGDISRGRRQQAFLKALLLKALSKETLTNPARFAKFVNAATRYLTVDSAFSVSDIYSLALSMKDLRGDDIVFITAPFTGFGRSPQGASIDIVDYTKMGQLSTALKTDRMDAFPLGQ